MSFEWLFAGFATVLGAVAAFAASSANVRSKEWKELQDIVQGQLMRVQSQLESSLREQDLLRQERNSTLDRMRREIEELRQEVRDWQFKYQRLQIENAKLANQNHQLKHLASTCPPNVNSVLDALYGSGSVDDSTL